MEAVLQGAQLRQCPQRSGKLEALKLSLSKVGIQPHIGAYAGGEKAVGSISAREVQAAASSLHHSLVLPHKLRNGILLARVGSTLRIWVPSHVGYTYQ